MNTRKVLIVSDTNNIDYWNTLTEAAKEKVGSVQIERVEEIDRQSIQQKYNLIVMDISDIKKLYHLIAATHEQQPTSQIVVITSVPTWKLTREVFRLGAADLIRKPSNPDTVFNALQPLMLLSQFSA
jgi:DNA-binding NtrC family response regulator